MTGGYSWYSQDTFHFLQSELEKILFVNFVKSNESPKWKTWVSKSKGGKTESIYENSRPAERTLFITFYFFSFIEIDSSINREVVKFHTTSYRKWYEIRTLMRLLDTVQFHFFIPFRTCKMSWLSMFHLA